MKKMAFLYGCALVLSLALTAPASAANVNIDGLPAASSVATGDLFECEQSSVNHKCTSDQVKAFIGGVTSVATSCGVSGGPITGAGTISGNSNPNVQSGANYPFVTGDCGSIVYLSNASNQIPTIPQAGTTGFAKGYYVEACNIGAGTQTITPATSTIGGAATYVLAAGSAAAPKCVGINSDGTNYVLDLTGIGGGGAPSGAAGGDLAGTYPNPTLGFASASAAAAAADADTFPTNQGAGTLKQTLAAIKTWIKSWFLLTGDCSSSSSLVASCYQHQTYVVNNWYAAGGLWVAQVASSSATAANTIRCYPAYFNGPATISAIGFKINSINAGSIQAAIYANNATSVRPTGNPLASTASISTAAATDLNAAISLPITSNPLLWWCSNLDNAVATVNALNPNLAMVNQIMGSVSQANVGSGSANTSGWSYSQTFGTWPDLTAVTPTAEITNTNIPLLKIKIGSVP